LAAVERGSRRDDSLANDEEVLAGTGIRQLKPGLLARLEDTDIENGISPAAVLGVQDDDPGGSKKLPAVVPGYPRDELSQLLPVDDGKRPERAFAAERREGRSDMGRAEGGTGFTEDTVERKRIGLAW